VTSELAASFDDLAPAPTEEQRAGFDPSAHVDRRKRPTPMLSRYSFFGGRRRSREPNTYTDNYGAFALSVMLLLNALNVLDSFFTLLYLQRGGAEANPIAAWMLSHGPAGFILLKTCFFGFASAILCLHKNFGRARVGIWIATAAYGLLMLYHMFLFFRRDIGTEL